MEEWHNTLCGFFNATIPCMVSCFCPVAGTACVQKTAIQMFEPQTANRAFLIACLGCCIGNAVNRQKIAATYGIESNYCKDAVVYCFCWVCMSTQEYLEVVWRKTPV